MKKLVFSVVLTVVQAFATTVYWIDDFESNNHSLNSVIVNNWGVTPSVDVVGPDLWGISNCRSGEHCIDLDGTGLDPGGTISRTFSVLRDGPHLLEWYNSGSQRGYPATQFSSMLVSITDGVNTKSSVVTLRFNHPWTAHAMPFQVANPSNITVSFTGFDNFDVGLLLDDVKFIDPRNGTISTTHMPEPTSMAMFGVGLIAFGLYRKR